MLNFQPVEDKAFYKKLVDFRPFHASRERY
jgi:hypothetical protein